MGVTVDEATPPNHIDVGTPSLRLLTAVGSRTAKHVVPEVIVPL
jgi:hypothetical protein